MSRSHVSLRARVANMADSERAQSSSQMNAQVLPWLTPRRLRWVDDMGQTPHQRVGDECRSRLISMLLCAMDASTAQSAVLAAATERPSAVSAAMVEWGTVPHTPIATTTSGSKVQVCGSRAPGTRRATEALGLHESHGSYLAAYAR